MSPSHVLSLQLRNHFNQSYRKGEMRVIDAQRCSARWQMADDTLIIDPARAWH
jgi:hypothetical protein